MHRKDLESFLGLSNAARGMWLSCKLCHSVKTRADPGVCTCLLRLIFDETQAVSGMYGGLLLGFREARRSSEAQRVGVVICVETALPGRLSQVFLEDGRRKRSPANLQTSISNWPSPLWQSVLQQEPCQFNPWCRIRSRMLRSSNHL